MAEGYNDASDILLNKKHLGLEFYHLASGHTAKFKAFLTNYDDAFSSEWASERVYGRMDPIHTFQGTERTITLAWDVPAAEFKEAEANFTNASKMYAMLYPAYKNGTTSQGSSGSPVSRADLITSPPLVKLKFGNLIFDASVGYEGSAKTAGLLGWIKDLSFAPDLEAGFFDTKPHFLIPQTIKLACTFNVIHTHKLGWDADQQATGGKRPLRKEGQNFPYYIDVGSPGTPPAPQGADHTPPSQTQSLVPQDEVQLEEEKRKTEEALKKQEQGEAQAGKVLGSGWGAPT